MRAFVYNHSLKVFSPIDIEEYHSNFHLSNILSSHDVDYLTLKSGLVVCYKPVISAFETNGFSIKGCDYSIEGKAVFFSGFDVEGNIIGFKNDFSPTSLESLIE